MDEHMISLTFANRNFKLYFVIGPELEAIQSIGFYTDLCLGLTTLFTGAFLSTLITNFLNETSNDFLTVLLWIFGIVGVIFLLLTIAFWFNNKKRINEIKKNPAPMNTSTTSVTQTAPAPVNTSATNVTQTDVTAAN